MPSSTFHNLPPEKRAKILEAACAEFARVPYTEVSINKIIRAAGIPRGSFYMYFKDKRELFFYLLEAGRDRLIELLGAFLDAREGNPFDACLDLFDALQATPQQIGQNLSFQMLVTILRQNPELLPSILTEWDSQSCFLSQLFPKVDCSLLSLRNEQDLSDIFFILARLLGPAIVNLFLTSDPDRVRSKLVNLLDILQRGMLKSPDPTSL